MRYVIACSGSIAQLYAQLLITEIDRFDFRARFMFLCHEEQIPGSLELRGEVSFSEQFSEIKHFNPDAFFLFAHQPKSSWLKKMVRLGAWPYFFQITNDFKFSQAGINKIASGFRRVFCDLPLYMQTEEVRFPGHFLTDMVRRYAEVVENPSGTGSKVAFLCSTSADHRLLKRLSTSSSTIQGVEIPQNKSGHEAEFAFRRKIAMLREANAAIVTSDFDEILCAYVSCPAVRVKKHAGWFSPEEYSLVGRLIGEKQKVVSRDINDILSEIDTLLSDHERCAEKLIKHQRALEVIGSNPVVRPISQSIVDELEAKN